MLYFFLSFLLVITLALCALCCVLSVDIFNFNMNENFPFFCTINQKKIKYLNFFFIILVSPMLSIPHQLVGVPIGHEVTIECFTEAHPTSLNYWTRDDGHMIHDSKKYR